MTFSPTFPNRIKNEIYYHGGRGCRAYDIKTITIKGVVHVCDSDVKYYGDDEGVVILQIEHDFYGVTTYIKVESDIWYMVDDWEIIERDNQIEEVE